MPVDIAFFYFCNSHEIIFLCLQKLSTGRDANVSVLAAVLVLRVGSACGAVARRRIRKTQWKLAVLDGPGCPLRLDYTLAERLRRGSAVVKTIGGLPPNLSLGYIGSISVTHSLTSASPTQKSGRFFKLAFAQNLHRLVRFAWKSQGFSFRGVAALNKCFQLEMLHECVCQKVTSTLALLELLEVQKASCAATSFLNSR